MKYIRLIAFLFWSAIAWCGALCLNAQEKEFVASAKINVPFVEARASLRDDLKWNYGVALSTQKLFPRLSFSLKAGNLSVAGSLSKLNSPALSSSISAFSSSSLRTTALEVSLPQYESFPDVQGYYFEALFTPNNIFKQITVNCFYKDDKKNDESSFTASTRIKITPAKKTEISFSSTAGVYPYKKKNVSSWFMQESFYNQGKHVCLNNQVSVILGGFSSLFILGTYQSPFGDFVNIWRIENLLKLKHFSFTLNGFYNSNNEVVTSSDKKLKPLLQLSGGGQYDFITETKLPLKITTGINTLIDINLAEKNHTLKSALGIRYSAADFSGLVGIDISMKLMNNNDGINTDFESGSLETSNNFYINDFTPAVTTKFTFTPDAKKTKWTFSQKFGLKLVYDVPSGTVSFSNNNQITFTQKTDESKNKIAFTSSLSATIQFRFCTLRVHLEFQV